MRKPLPQPGSRGAKVLLTDRYIASAARVKEAEAAGGRIEYRDSEVRGFRLRVSASGFRSFLLVARFPPSRDPSRRSIGPYPEVTLEEARRTALDWRRQIRAGIDPSAAQRDAKAAAVAVQAEASSPSFATVAQDYIHQHVAGLATFAETTAMVRRMAALFGDIPIADITPEQCQGVIEDVQRQAREASAHHKGSKGGAATARRHFGTLQHLFSWASGKPSYRLSKSPMASLKASSIVDGKISARTRVLTESEIGKVWNAAEAEGYPYGRICQGLLLTCARLTEISDMRWEQVDLTNKRLTILPKRVGGESEALPNVLPMDDMMVAFFQSLPRFQGPFVFSTDGGRGPYQGFGRAKRRLDAAVGFDDWRIHDLRRSVRSLWSALPGHTDVVRELTMSHRQRGIQGIYDRHAYSREKGALLADWHAMLQGIVNPPSGNVVALGPRRRKA